MNSRAELRTANGDDAGLEREILRMSRLARPRTKDKANMVPTMAKTATA